MKNLIDAIENNNSEETLRILKEEPSLLNQKSEDGWNVIQLASYYNLPEVVNYCLAELDYDAINNSKVHPLLIAIEEKNESVIDSFLNFENQNKINWTVKEKNGDNLVYLSLYYGLENIAERLVEKGISCFEKNNQEINAFSLIVEKGNSEFFNRFIRPHQLVEYYEETFIKKSIQYDQVYLFDNLLPYTQLTSDELFNLAAGFNSIKAMNHIMQSGDIIPGKEQITQIVDLMCQKYESQEDIKAAKELADYLFEIKIPFSNFVNKQGQSAWMLCIQNNNEEVFERLMQSNENVNSTDTEEHSPLFYAIERNNINFVSMLLKKKANPHQLDRHDNTPLIKAVEKGNVEIVKELLKYCQNINELNKNNEHALSMAIKRRRMDIVSELIWAGGEITINPVRTLNENHIFIIGSGMQSYHDEECIDNFMSLAKLGFRLDQKNSEGDTFLLHFIKNGYLSNFNALLKCQFSPNQIDKDGNSALMCSAMKRQNDYFDGMTRKFSNLDLNHKNNQGETVYDICLKTGKIKRMEELVNIDPKISLENSKKAAKIISKEGNLSEFASKLTKSGLDLSFQDEYGNNLLMYSLAGGNLNNFKYLVETVSMTIDMTYRNKNGNTIEDIINAMPESIKKDFSTYLHKNPNKKP